MDRRAKRPERPENKSRQRDHGEVKIRGANTRGEKGTSRKRRPGQKQEGKDRRGARCRQERKVEATRGEEGRGDIGASEQFRNASLIRSCLRPKKVPWPRTAQTWTAKPGHICCIKWIFGQVLFGFRLSAQSPHTSNKCCYIMRSASRAATCLSMFCLEIDPWQVVWLTSFLDAEFTIQEYWIGLPIMFCLHLSSFSIVVLSSTTEGHERQSELHRQMAERQVATK